MSVHTKTCVWVQCDGPSRHPDHTGWDDEGPFHFGTEAAALDWVLGEDGAGWTRLPYAQQWLDSHNVAPIARSRFDEFLKQNPAAAKGAQSEADRDALFKQFQAWQADQASKDTANARAQVVRPSKQQ